MSLKPLDLQTLFVRLNEVSKQQAARQEAVMHAQQVAGQEIEQQTKMADKRVARTEETSDGPEKLHDDQTRQGASGEGGSSAEDRESEDEQEKKRDDPFRDPDLGNRIDINT
jgi:hypothetical protein